jgi:trk system potassium uptake protein TrkA
MFSARSPTTTKPTSCRHCWAKRLGARKTIALINNPAYVDLLQGDDIDIAFSPQQATLGTLLTKVRRGSVSTVHSLRRGAAEAMEIVAKGDRKASRVVGPPAR